jgi:hypothetical protein
MTNKPTALVKKQKARKAVGRKPGTAVDSPELREKFLSVLRQTGNVGVAAETINVYRTTPYQWKRKDPAFAKQWDEALDAAADIVEAEVRRRAVEGFEEPVFYKGEVVGYVTRYSDRMLELLMKALKPEKFREKAIPDGQIVIQIAGVEEIKRLREEQPWSAEVEAAEEAEWKPVTIKTEDMTPRQAAASDNSRQKKSKRGLVPGDGEDFYEEGDE